MVGKNAAESSQPLAFLLPRAQQLIFCNKLAYLWLFKIYQAGAVGSLLCVAWQIVRPQSMDLSEVFKAKNPV